MGGRTKTSWAKGQSGNPKGQPKRVLTGLLEAACEQTIIVEGRKVSQAQRIAEMIWSAAVTGKVTYQDGTVKALDFDEWFAVVCFIFRQIDGPPRRGLEQAPGLDVIKAYISLELERV